MGDVGWVEDEAKYHGYTFCEVCNDETFHMIYRKDDAMFHKKESICQRCGDRTLFP